MMRSSDSPSPAARSLKRRYIQLFASGATLPRPVDAAFWREIDRRRELHEGRLLGAFELDEGSSDHCEMHPAGDEILVLTAGEARLILYEAQGERALRLLAGQACIVPRGIWHRVDVRKRGELIFITPGAGTEHRPLSQVPR